MIKDHEFIFLTDKPGTKLKDATGGFIELNSSWQSCQQINNCKDGCTEVFL